jgi:hypothetical protein
MAGGVQAMFSTHRKNSGAILQPAFAILIALPAISSLGYLMAGGGLDTDGWGEDLDTSTHEILGVSVGMSDLEVRIAIGEPVFDEAHPEVWLYSGGELYIRFNENNTVSAVCYPPAPENPIIHEKLTEKEVKQQFGDPIHESFHESGLKKMMNYNHPQYSFGIQLNQAQLFCVHDGQGMIYDKEYKRS